MPRPPRSRAPDSSPRDPVASARTHLLDGVGRDIAASFPGITRLGGQIVAALYLSDEPRSMDELSEELGRSKSNIFANLRGLEAAGIVERTREAGARHDTFRLRGKYPDVVVGAYLARLRRVVADKRQLSRRALEMLGDAKGKEADMLRNRLHSLMRKYDRFGAVMDELLPSVEGPIDIETLIDALPANLVSLLTNVARRALGLEVKKRAG
jgi:DNA-binding transcriptional regulator GbsR (MarR family)